MWVAEGWRRLTALQTNEVRLHRFAHHINTHADEEDDGLQPFPSGFPVCP